MTRDENVALLKRAMELVFNTHILDAEVAARRGEAIRAIDAMLIAEGEESYADELDARY